MDRTYVPPETSPLMARIRSIKPEFWTDGRMVKLPMAVRLFYIGLWNFADDWGVLEDDPESLKLRIMPADDIDPVDLVEKLVIDGRLTRKVAPDGSRVLVIRRWGDHQRIDKRSPGRWGNPSEFDDAPQIPATPSEDSAGREWSGQSEIDRDFEVWWSAYPRKVHRAAAFSAYRARRRDGISHARLDLARCHFKTAKANEDQRFVMHGATFLARNGPWSEYESGGPEGEEPKPALAVINPFGAGVDLGTPKVREAWSCAVENPECVDGWVDDGNRSAVECECRRQKASSA